MSIALEQPEQRSVSWEEWRKKGIGASDAPAVMNASPWKTRFQLWEEKMGQTEGFKGNWATQRGNDLEPLARQTYELMTDIDMEPVLMVHPEFTFMRASLDGYNAELKRVVEIKCPGKPDHATALQNKVPEKYKWQLQHQMFVAGVNEADYFSFDGQDGVIVKVKADPEMQRQLLEECKKFWNCVQTGKPPELSEKDFVVMEPSKSDVALIDRFKLLTLEAAKVHDELETLRNEIIERFAKATRVKVGGLKITQTTRKGAVDYAKIPELQGVDLESFRKKATTFTTVSVDGVEE